MIVGVDSAICVDVGVAVSLFILRSAYAPNHIENTETHQCPGGQVTAKISADSNPATTDKIITENDDSRGVVVQSVSEGGGNGAFNVTGGISVAKSVAGNIGIGIGGFGGKGGETGAVSATISAEVMDAIRTKLMSRVEEMKVDVDANRFEQELVMIAQKLDVDEELDRLDSHLQELDSVINKDQPVGRRLDFLMQELNREANTLSSKSSDIVTTQAAVDMKVNIEQMREQVQNIE